ncbi:hydrolase [Alicyclobacillaceae bacterium I2511]|nr:hydrolase [Alicyclobacillaceae bacterium I2511]
MLGRTHMAIGAVGSVVVAPVILRFAHWESLRQAWGGQGQPHLLMAEALLVGSAVVGSLLPDLDQPDSIMAKKVERVGQGVLLIALLALLFFLHLELSLVAWGFAMLLAIVMGTRGHTRKIGLGILGAGILGLGIHGDLPWAGAILLALWTAGALFTAHRTFTHSLFGVVALTAGMFVVLDGRTLGYGLSFSVAVWGLFVGYVLHLLADMVSGGVPLLWPWRLRQGVHWVKTGSVLDHGLGAVATLVFLALVIL